MNCFIISQIELYLSLNYLLFNMKYWLIFFGFLSVFSTNSQTYNPWSVDANIGFTSALGPFAEGYRQNYLGLYHADANIRYMLSNKFGVMWGMGFDRIKNDELGYHQTSLDFKVHVIRTSFQAVLNVGRIANFETIHERFGLLLHGGFGFGSMKDAHNSVWFKDWKYQGTDEMMHAIIGFTTQWRIKDYLALHMDISYISNLWQSHTFDFTVEDFNHNVDGNIANYSVGASYYFSRNGGRKKHLDWVWDAPNSGGNSNLKSGDTIIQRETIRTIETIRIINGDTTSKKPIDKYAPNEDFDGDGVPNSRDACPTTPGDDENGCPNADKDGDGIANSIDDCPDVKGTAKNGGCPGLDLETKKTLNEALRNVEFENGSDILIESSAKYIDRIVDVMKNHQDYKIHIIGHTDNSGETGPNLSLSKSRANVVKEYVVSKGVDENRVTSEGVGEKKPIASNDNPAGRAQNERIEFTIKFQ